MGTVKDIIPPGDNVFLLNTCPLDVSLQAVQKYPSKKGVRLPSNQE